MVSLIYAESNPKLIELYRVGAVFTINLKNKTLAITSSTTYWNYTIIYVWLNGILNSNLPRIEFLTRTITARSEKQVYDLQISVTKYIIISIWSEDRMGWPYTVTRGVSGIEATQNWAICFIGNPTGNFTFKVAALKIK